MQRFLPFLLAALMLVVAFAVTSSGSQPQTANADYWCYPDSGYDDDGDCVQNSADSCPNTPESDVPGNKTSYSWGYGYGSNPADPGGTDSYGCSLAQIQDADLDHYCDNQDFDASTDYNDRCWVRDVCPGTASGDVANTYEWGTGYPGGSGPDNGGLDSYGCALAQIEDADLDRYCDNSDYTAADANDRCFASVADLCPGAAEDNIGAEDGCPEFTSSITLRKVVLPGTDTTLFDLLIDGTAAANDIGNGGSSGMVPVAAGTYIVKETFADGNSLSGYSSKIVCRLGVDGAIIAQGNGSSLNVTLNEEEDVVCTFTNLGLADLGTCKLTSYNSVIIGDDNANVLNGTNGDDLIIGLDGADTIDGRGGNDCIVGGPGDDRLLGGTGNDRIYGNAGKDTVDGGIGNDVIYGGADEDTLAGGNDNDTIYGDGGADTINTGNSSGSGRNYAYGGEGDDTLNGGVGRDTLVGETGTDKANGGAGAQDQCSAETKLLCESAVLP